MELKKVINEFANIVLNNPFSPGNPILKLSDLEKNVEVTNDFIWEVKHG